MLAGILLLLALHTPQTARDIAPAPTSSTECTFAVTGHVIFPAYADPVHFFDMELRPYGPGFPIPAKTGPYEGFLIEYVPPGNYSLEIELPGYDVVQQLISLQDCHKGPSKYDPGTVVYFDIQLHRSPAIKPLPIAEDAVSIKTLMSKTPDKIMDAFEKSLDKEPKAGPAQTSTSLQEILQTSPDYYEANLELGLEYKKTGQLENSVQALRHALELNDGSMRARAALGQYRFDVGDFQGAAKLLGEAVRLGSTSPDVYYMLGTSYYKLNRLDLAEAALRRALAIDSGIGNAHLQLFNVYMKGNLPEQALKEANIYLEEYPDAKDRDYVQSMIAKDISSAKPLQTEPARAGIAPELEAVLHRATEYVTKYEAELGDLIGTEEYLQNSIWPDMSMNMRKAPSRTVTRRTSSDFMLINVGPNWVALREVNTVNGAKVKSEQPPLEAAFDNSPANNTKIFNSLKADSTRYNIGDVLRENNLPTFALQVLRQGQVSRFSFEKTGNDKLDGIPVWRVKFRELTGPTLVSSKEGGKNLYSMGTLWIEPETGRILKTEFQVDNPFANPVISSSAVVTYAEDKARNMLVPGVMTEHYETVSNIIDCRAEYSKFHPYTVDVKFDLAPVKPTP